jgi:hypothetical protein
VNPYIWWNFLKPKDEFRIFAMIMQPLGEVSEKFIQVEVVRLIFARQLNTRRRI